MSRKIQVALKDKILLTIEEAAAYSGISETVLRNRLKEYDYDFVLKNGTKTMIKRKGLETYLERVDAI